MKTKYKTSDSELMKALGFTQDELEMNREGIISPRQKRTIFVYSLMSGLSCGFFVSMITFAVIIILSSNRVNPQQWFVGGMIIGFIIGTIFFLQMLRNNKVEACRGLINKIATGQRDTFSSGVGIKMNKLHFPVNGVAFNLLTERDEYIIYYSSKTKTLLAIEPVDEEMMSI